MSIYNRSYMRENYSRQAKSFDALKTILIALVGVFVIQKIFENWIAPEFLSTWFGLSAEGITSGLIHTVLSYGYLHSTVGVIPWHLLINGLIIYFVGRPIQERYGAQRLWEIFHFCVLVGGLVWLLLELIQMNTTGLLGGHLVGASAAGYGLLVLFFFERWSERTTILLYFVFPVSFTGKTGFFVITGIQLFMFLFAELNHQTNTAYSAHLGGIGAAYLYYRFLLSRPTLLSFLQDLKSSGNPSTSTPHARPKTGKVTLNLSRKESVPASRTAPETPSTSALRAEVDRILDKINSEGFGALSAEEKLTLDQAKDKLR